MTDKTTKNSKETASVKNASKKDTSIIGLSKSMISKGIFPTPLRIMAAKVAGGPKEKKK